MQTETPNSWRAELRLTGPELDELCMILMAEMENTHTTENGRDWREKLLTKMIEAHAKFSGF